MASIPIETVSRTIQRAAIDPDAWVDVQDQCERFMGAFCSQLARVDHAHGNAVWLRTTHYLEFGEHFAEVTRDSEPVLYAARNPRWRRFTDSDFITPEEIARSPFYAACARYEIGWRLALRLADEPEVSKAIVFLWRPQEGHVGQADLDRLGLIERQLRLAAFVANRLPGGLLLHGHLLDALERAECAALIATPVGIVLHANLRAEAMLRAGDGLAARHGALAVAKPARDAVARALAAAGRIQADPKAALPGGTVAVPRPSGLPPYFVTAAPLPAGTGFLAPAQPPVLVLIRDPAACEAPDRALLVRGFGLTPAEAAVCQRFAAGATPREIAEARGVGEGSLRQQLKSVMAKLGVTRQAELMRLLRALPGEGHIPDGR